MKKIRILLIEDNEADYLLLKRHLRTSVPPVDLSWVTGDDNLAFTLAEGGFDIILTDYNIPGLDFSDILRTIRHR